MTKFGQRNLTNNLLTKETKSLLEQNGAVNITRNLGNVFIAIGGFVVFLSIVFYFVGLSPQQIVIYPYRPQAPLTATIGFILVAIGIVFLFIETKREARLRCVALSL